MSKSCDQELGSHMYTIYRPLLLRTCATGGHYFLCANENKFGSSYNIETYHCLHDRVESPLGQFMKLGSEPIYELGSETSRGRIKVESGVSKKFISVLFPVLLFCLRCFVVGGLFTVRGMCSELWLVERTK